MEDTQLTSETQMELPEPELSPKPTRKEKKAGKVEVEQLTEVSVETPAAGDAAARAAESAASPAIEGAEALQVVEATAESEATNEPEEESAGAKLDRKRIEEQLEALKRRESELRRALAVADHPELAEAIRSLEGCAYALSRAEGKLAQGLSKAEERRRDTLEKKLALAREKRAEIDAQIAELEGELATLTDERTRAFEAERKEAMERLLAALGTHTAALVTAGLEASALVPELARWMPEIRTLAEKLAARG